MGKIELTLTELRMIARDSFKDGEQWGITHSTWFIPSEEKHQEKYDQSFDEIMERLNLVQD